jgi:CRP/FNR family cyclic AMP-dependent transcriptional regulator
MSTDPLYARFGRDFPEGHVLFREGEAGSVMYVVQRGRVRIARQLPGGERTLAVLGPGEFFRRDGDSQSQAPHGDGDGA